MRQCIQEWTKWNLWKKSFKKIEKIFTLISLKAVFVIALSHNVRIYEQITVVFTAHALSWTY